MSLVLVDQGENAMLTAFFAAAMTLRLYTNNYTPVETTTESGVTEASGNGYAAKALAGGGWTISGTAPTQAAFAQQTYTFTGPLGNVYGYYVTRDSDAKLMYAERFSDGPYNIVNNGDTIKITPVFTQD
jgi:hypothetical protein